LSNKGIDMSHYFFASFTKKAEEARQEDNHTIRRILLGTPLSAAVAAPWGTKLEHMGRARGNAQGSALIGLGGGSLAGAGMGALAGILARKHVGEIAGMGALLGGALGANLGRLHGNFNQRADEIHRDAVAAGRAAEG
jgi:hypothetical protein